MDKYIVELLGLVLTMIVSMLATQLKKYLESKNILDVLKTKEKTIDSVVRAVEQVYTDLDGQQKFVKAKHKSIELLKLKGIDITYEELENIIESCVKSMNDSWDY